MRANQSKYLIFLIWLSPLLFFTFQFILRLWPGLMMTQIMEQLSIDASQFGLIAACYYYGYSLMQIPVAMSIDKFGVRNVSLILISICGIASFFFAQTNNFYVALLSRFFVGAGSAVAFLSVSKLTSELFDKNSYGKMIGISFSIGLMGAIYGGKPLSLLAETYDWKLIAMALSLITITMAVLIYCALGLAPKSQLNDSQTNPEKVSFKFLLTSPTIWLLAIANLLMVGCLEGFADVWGIQYLVNSYGIERSSAAGIVSFIFFGMLFGGPILALFSRKFGDYLVISFCGLLMCLIFLYLLGPNTYNYVIFCLLFFILGIACCYQVIVFSAGSQLVPKENLGMTIAFLNSINMLGGSFFHTCIGNIMDLLWNGEINSLGNKIYDIQTYKYALSIIPISAVAGSIIIAYISIRAKRSTLTNS